MTVPSRSVALTGSDQVAYSGPATLAGFSIRETAGSTAVVRIRDGITDTGPIIETIRLAANAYEREGHMAVSCATGVFVEVVSGTIEGAVRVA